MGLNTTKNECGHPGEAGRAVTGSLVGTTTVPAPLNAALLRLLGSEDTLFRDPFADFTPSGR